MTWGVVHTRCVLKRYIYISINTIEQVAALTPLFLKLFMTQNLDVQELTLVILVERQDYSLLTLDFLHYSGMISQDWELSHHPVCSQQVAPVSCQNLTSILALSDKAKAAVEQSHVVPGPWQNIRIAPMRLLGNLAYTLENKVKNDGAIAGVRAHARSAIYREL
jgi:hypothetical protein